ncbi:MAG TPA: zinc ribbon domain-containing protein [Spirochaetia bacterium]|nr:zinc ribbon domain-containing protein [Spirochaetia bacterium]
MIDFSAYGEQTPHIKGIRCGKCGAVYYPAPMVCGKCDALRDPTTNKGWEEFDLDGACTLLTWTRVWNLPEGFNKKYLLFGMVEFENGLRASGRIEMEGDPKSGMKLTARAIEADERPGKPVKVLVFS